MYNQKRPVQFNITNHINRCEADAIAQKEWIAEGGLYYANTIKLFKERAYTLRQIATMYEDLYNAMTVDSLALPDNKVDNNDDLSDFLQLEESDYVSDINETVFVLLENYKTSKTLNDTKLSKTLVKQLKQSLGKGFDRLYANCQSDPQPTTLNICRKILFTWFKDRCNWNTAKKANSLIYNLAAVPESLDAIIIAYSKAVVESTYDTVYQRAQKFSDELADWLYNEGEGHIRGQSEPYKQEGYGLVSKDIVQYVYRDENSEDILCSHSFSVHAVVLATYIERIIKPELYNIDANKCNTMSDKYMKSIEMRSDVSRHLDLAKMTTQELHEECKQFLNERCESNE